MRRTIARFTLLAALAVGASGCGRGAAPSTDEGTSTQGAGAPAENDGTEPTEGSSGGETEAGGPSDGGGDESAAENQARSEEHTSELQSRGHLVCRLLLEKKKNLGEVRMVLTGWDCSNPQRGRCRGARHLP